MKLNVEEARKLVQWGFENGLIRRQVAAANYSIDHIKKQQRTLEGLKTRPASS